eukprot:GHVQ01019693.1.p1 GENE.GHVQ01019693.1~~GHVQ01019693.1.p1  ORF type:complete len:570 (-),score=63.84 GHVQ01019693.1:249-1958(-)
MDTSANLDQINRYIQQYHQTTATTIGERGRQRKVKINTERIENSNRGLEIKDTRDAYGVVECCWDKLKGRVLISREVFRPGDVMFSESPLHAVAEDTSSWVFQKLSRICKSNSLGLEPIWFWCALNSLEMCSAANSMLTQSIGAEVLHIRSDTKQRLLSLHAPDNQAISSEGRKVLKHLGLDKSISFELFDKLLRVWVYNCYEDSTYPLGYALFYLASFMSHSCSPNAIWIIDPLTRKYLLRARTNIRVGEEVTISYLSEEVLLNPSIDRNIILSDTKLFSCTCQRCIVDSCRTFRCPLCEDGRILVKHNRLGLRCTNRCVISQQDRLALADIEKRSTQWILQPTDIHTASVEPDTRTTAKGSRENDKSHNNKRKNSNISNNSNNRNSIKSDKSITNVRNKINSFPVGLFDVPLSAVLRSPSRARAALRQLHTIFSVHWLLFKFMGRYLDVEIPPASTRVPHLPQTTHCTERIQSFPVDMRSTESCLLYQIQLVKMMYANSPCGYYAWALETLGDVSQERGDDPRAIFYYREAAGAVINLFGMESIEYKDLNNKQNNTDRKRKRGVNYP